MPDVPAGDWVLRASVPEGIFTLAIEADDITATAEHAAFADRCQPLLLRAVGDDVEEAAWLRSELIGQLDGLRRSVAADGLGYLGALAGDRDGRPVLILLGIAAAPIALPDGIDPASLLAAMLRRQYPGAAVEEFPTAHGVSVGIRRSEETALPAPADKPLTIAAGISQALVPFPEAGLLGTVTGFCFTPADIDVATVFTATIAYHLTVVPQGLVAVLPNRHGNRDEFAVSAVQQAAAWPGRLADEVAREPQADQVPLGQRGRRRQAATPGPLGFNLPAAKTDADALGLSGEHQRLPGISPEGDEAAQFASGVAIAQDLGIVDQQNARSAGRAQRCCQLFCTKRWHLKQPQNARCTGKRAQRRRPGCCQHDRSAGGQQ
jgi:hypothetical protein